MPSPKLRTLTCWWSVPIISPMAFDRVAIGQRSTQHGPIEAEGASRSVSSVIEPASGVTSPTVTVVTTPWAWWRTCGVSIVWPQHASLPISWGLEEPMNDSSRGITLPQYAALKKVPIEDLRSYGLSDLASYKGRPAIAMTYKDSADRTIATRYRCAASKSNDGQDERFQWSAGSRTTLYGLWRLEAVRNRGYVVLVEGESDCHTLWYAGFPALGVAGATNWNDERDLPMVVGDFPIYVVREPDAGGDSLVARLRSSTVRPRIRVMMLSTKDVSDLWVELDADLDRFRAEVQHRMDMAIPLEPEPWPELIPIHQSPELPGLDLCTAIPDCLPELRAFITCQAQAVQVPIEMVAPLCLSLMSLGVARALEVQCNQTWREPAQLWVVCLAAPGERKSATLSAIAAPFHAWQKAQRDILREELARHEEQRRIAEASLNAIRTCMAKPGKTGSKDIDRESLHQQAEELAGRISAMPNLTAPELITSDCTPEAARDLLVRNGEKLGIIASEGDQIDVLLGRYSEGRANLGLFLNAYSGDPCPAHRVGKDAPLDGPALVFAMAVQPQAILAALDSPDAVGRGLVARFIFVQPVSLLGHRDLEPPPVDGWLTAWWADHIRALLKLPWPGKVVIGPDGAMRANVMPGVLTLDAEAHEVLLRLRANLEPRLDPQGGDLHRIAAFASKLPGMIARIALSFQAMADPEAKTISGDCMRAACEWGPFLLAHHQATVDGACEPYNRRHARRLINAILRGRASIVSERDLFNSIEDSAVPDMQSFRPVLREVESRNYLRRLPAVSGARGRPSIRYEVHPNLFGPAFEPAKPAKRPNQTIIAGIVGHPQPIAGTRTVDI
jgi:hypothetical protein